MVSGYLLREVRDRIAIARDLAREPGRSWATISTIADGLDVMFAVTHYDANVGAPVFVHASQHAYPLTGYWPSELVGQNPSVLQVDTTYDALARRFMRKLIATGEAELRIKNRRKNGELYGCEIAVLHRPETTPQRHPDYFAFLSECSLDDCP